MQGRLIWAWGLLISSSAALSFASRSLELGLQEQTLRRALLSLVTTTPSDSIADGPMMGPPFAAWLTEQRVVLALLASAVATSIVAAGVAWSARASAKHQESSDLRLQATGITALAATLGLVGALELVHRSALLVT